MGGRMRQDGSRFWAHGRHRGDPQFRGVHPGLRQGDLRCPPRRSWITTSWCATSMPLSPTCRRACACSTPRNGSSSRTPASGRCSAFLRLIMRPERSSSISSGAIVSRGGPDEQHDAVVTDVHEHHRRLILQPGGGTTLLKVGSDRVYSIAHRSHGRQILGIDVRRHIGKDQDGKPGCPYGAPRRPDGPAQQVDVPPKAAGGPSSSETRRDLRGVMPRPRPFQDGQRHARPSRRRQAAGGHRR